MNWKTNALAATRGTKLGAILRCALDEDNVQIPRFTSTAVVTSDGFIMADFIDRNGDHHMGAFVGDVASLRGNAVGLAAHLELADADRKALFATFSDWVARDYSGKGLGL